jgi:hypothetical protein
MNIPLFDFSCSRDAFKGENSEVRVFFALELI